MEYRWDEAKRLTNLRKHGIDFADVPAVFDGDILTVEDDRLDYGEQRFVTLGLLKGRIIAVVPEMLNPYIKLYIQADENRRSLREIKFPSCDKIKLT
ncbi:MAG: BrnT family toxin [Microcystis wesenbergii Mw_QC_S_20081001_S30D]|jgi:uncharacterized DUF497 family protein|uniref:BrnT family toxin n=1 Tax=Microcystis wesenbergii Mw_QC_S_20081001_S30D TaxID=2486245 RepID=A0A552K1C6_9CHRO|nr:MAG: BrnT family toxin [Microcystis wesenbergii Mw_QC_B_20070930_S4D]TRV01827.1 MAG: BrnT family toxin [Microcystis wesenbergii Mw_QC_S_20081001_S30D]TRV03886.1 MAG: BrnT family toxin [Microcystis wesenbergii Mw_QC_S_20081001_S30]TRV16654.1 MAG: BrnT family toxin [Microcystis wesenbergii Mw_QC_B_20070930_S4]